MTNDTSRTWREIKLDNIEHNYFELRKHLKSGVKFLGVVKANGYGHGAVRVAERLQSVGCDYLATATLYEALELRRSGITLPILILGYTDPEYTEALIDSNITQNISSCEMAIKMSAIAEKLGKKLRAHIKLDTGMGRLGFITNERLDCTDDILPLLKLNGLDIEGIFTHFAVSEIEDETYTRAQFKYFSDTVSEIEEKSGFKFKIKHCANSGATLKFPEMQLDMVRPGIALYGFAPGDSLFGFDLIPAMELKSRIYSIKNAIKGSTISYGRRFEAQSDRKIAVMPMGYADGLHRVLSNKLTVSVRGHIVPQVGSICMDMCMLDVTDVPDIEVGDIVTVFGRDVPIEDMAKKAGTINYELLCALSERIPRVYL